MAASTKVLDPEFTSGSIKLDGEKISVNWYYFPAGTKKIRYDQVVKARKMKWSGGPGHKLLTTKHWGMAVSKVWWHLDWGRMGRQNFVEIDTGSWLKIGLTCDDCDGLAKQLEKRLPAGVWDQQTGEI
eukprot:TRINITY_DN10061_c0_g1_i1.p1 TRINITY_DN10061_c0_g1~~TRINITY_DN10061_c0_g1_i1.p1  ORF type:complete len:128 (+),score=28.26 TRINITY_DN10061_c0_g1_i1:52-435(+)